MDPETRSPSPEALLENAAWVRRIARRLVHDPERAEDVAQDALAVALERPPAFAGDPSRLRRWLAGVVRHLAARGRRESERRAREHEADGARVTSPPTGDAVARLELHRLLTAAVLELDEPYRSTVALRYFDGLSPRAIAARQGVESAAVRKRLERAHALLRAKLDRRFEGGRGAWCAVLAPLARTGSIAATSGTGAVLMGTKTAVGAAAAVVMVALAAWVGWNGLQSEAAPPEPAVAQDGGALQPAAVDPLRPESTQPAGSPQRAALPSESAAGREVRVVSSVPRAPLADALVLAFDADWELARARTDARGLATLPAGFVPLRVAACADGFNAVATEELAPTLIELELATERVLSGVVTVDGAPPGEPLELVVWTSTGVGDQALLNRFMRHLSEERGFHESGAVYTDERGHFELRGLDQDWSGRLRVLGELRIRDTRPALPIRENESVELREALTGITLETTRLPVLRGRVVSAETGAPVSRAELDILVVFEGGELKTPWTGCTTNALGRFARSLEPSDDAQRSTWLDPARRLPVERIEITAHGDLETAPQSFQIDADELADPLDVGDLVLSRHAPLWFRVLDEERRPIAGARVAAAGRTSADSGEDGRAVLRGLPAGPLALTAAAFGHRALLLDHGAERGSEDEPVVFTLAAGNVIEIHLDAPEGTRAYDLSVLLELPGNAIASAVPGRIDPNTLERLTGPAGGHLWSKEGIQLTLMPRASGVYAVSGLLPGLECRLSVTDNIGQLAAEERFVTPADGERQVLRVEIEGLDFELRGRVVDERGAPLAAADVRVVRDDKRNNARTDADGHFTVGPLLHSNESLVSVQASYPGRVARVVESVRLVPETAPVELVLEPAHALEVELVEASGGPAPATYLGATAEGVKTTYATALGAGRFAFDALPASEVELVTRIGGRVHRLRARGDAERARFMLPDHGALEVELPEGLERPEELMLRITFPGEAEFEEVASPLEPIALQPGVYEVELQRIRWQHGEQTTTALSSPRSVEVRAGHTTGVGLGS